MQRPGRPPYCCRAGLWAPWLEAEGCSERPAQEPSRPSPALRKGTSSSPLPLAATLVGERQLAAGPDFGAPLLTHLLWPGCWLTERWVPSQGRGNLCPRLAGGFRGPSSAPLVQLPAAGCCLFLVHTLTSKHILCCVPRPMPGCALSFRVPRAWCLRHLCVVHPMGQQVGGLWECVRAGLCSAVEPQAWPPPGPWGQSCVCCRWRVLPSLGEPGLPGSGFHLLGDLQQAAQPL